MVGPYGVNAIQAAALHRVLVFVICCMVETFKVKPQVLVQYSSRVAVPTLNGPVAVQVVSILSEEKLQSPRPQETASSIKVL